MEKMNKQQAERMERSGLEPVLEGADYLHRPQ